MFDSRKSLKVLCLICLLTSVPPTAFAGTDGYFSGGWGVRNKAMAGVGAALVTDSMTAAHNPANISFLDRRWDASLTLFSPTRYYDVAGSPTGPGSFIPGTVKSGNSLFIIPSFSMVWDRGPSEKLGVAFFGNGGMNTEWPESANMGHGTYGAGKTGVNLEQMFLAGTYAKRIDERTSLGASLILAHQRFSAQGLQAFWPGNPNLSNNGTDSSSGIGVKVGFNAATSDRVRVGAAWQPQIRMSPFKRYSSLFAAHGRFDIPETFTAGVEVKLNSKSRLGLDVKHIKYSEVPAVGNPMSNMGNGLGSTNGPGFGWRDMTITKLGYEVQASSDTTFRAGIGYGRQPIRSSEVFFNILAPGVQELHYTCGFTKENRRGGAWSMALTYSPEKTVSGPNPNDPTQTISLRMKQVEFELGYSQKF